MAYSPGFLYAMAQEASDNIYVSAKLVESGRLEPAKIAVKKNFGKTIKKFRRKSFYKFADSIRSPIVEAGGLYMPSIVSRSSFLNCGGFPEGNVLADSINRYIEGESFTIAKIGDKLVSGDDAFIRKYLTRGGLHITTNSAIVYHFQEGEKSTSNNASNKRIPSGIAILNDQLLGINGELTLWNYLIQDLTARGLRILPLPLGINQTFPYRFSRPQLWRDPKPRIVFRNATFLRTIAGPWRQIAVIWDKITDHKQLKLQSRALKNADACVTNSLELFDTLKLDQSRHNYLMPVPVHPLWESTPIVESLEKVFDVIFVGAFNETKGWGEIKELVYKFPQMKFLLVSKYSNDDPCFDNSIQPPNVVIQRCLNTHELLPFVDQSKIFVVGSPFETQCLAAMEAAFRNLVICMKETGSLSHLPPHLREQIGVFDSDLIGAFEEIIKRTLSEKGGFAPAKAMIDAGLSGISLREMWNGMILRELEYTFSIKIKPSLFPRIKNLIPKRVKAMLRKILIK
jgi:hypothetical protein